MKTGACCMFINTVTEPNVESQLEIALLCQTELIPELGAQT